MSTQQGPPIIIIKKKGGHGGHHGGAWKVAYADFVTAMMALFIVLWLLNSSVQVRKAISSYFQDPSGSGNLSGSASAGTGETVSVGQDDMEQLKDKLEEAVKKKPEFEKLKDYVQLSVTGEGLRVELLESEKGIFFESGSPSPSGLGGELIGKLADQLVKLPNQLLIEGHTDSKPFGKRKDYTNWELSVDRANAARRIIEEHGARPDQIVQVRGFAAQSPRNPADPEDASNRRVSVIVRYQNAVTPDDPEEAAEARKGNETESGKGEKGAPPREGAEKGASKEGGKEAEKGKASSKEPAKEAPKEAPKEAAKESPKGKPAEKAAPSEKAAKR
jgi:chemotaxis protein MotB